MLEVHGRNFVDELVRDDYKDSVTEILKNVLKGMRWQILSSHCSHPETMLLKFY